MAWTKSAKRNVRVERLVLETPAVELAERRYDLLLAQRVHERLPLTTFRPAPRSAGPYRLSSPRPRRARCMSRLASLSAMSWRLSYSFLPRPRPTSILARPSLRYTLVGTIV